MLKDVVTIMSRREMIAISALFFPLAAIEVLTIIGIRFFFLTMNDATTGGDVDAAHSFLPSEFDSFTIAMIVGSGLVLWLVLRSVLTHVIWMLIIRALANVQAQVLDRLFSKFVNLPLEERLKSTVSEQKHLIMLSAQAMFHQVLYPLSSVLVEAIIALAIVLVLLFIEPVATVLLAFWIGSLFGVYNFLLRGFATKAGQARWQSLHAIRRVLDGALGDLRWVKITRAEVVFRDLFRTQTAIYFDALTKDRAMALVPRSIVEIAIVSSILILFVYFTLANTTTGALFTGFALFAAASIRLFPALARISSLTHSLATHAPDLKQVIDNLDVQTDGIKHAPENLSNEPPFHDSISFRNVHFRYPEHGFDTLADVNLTIKTGERVLVSGPSGSGKSTFLSLALGLLEPTHGDIALDGNATSVLTAIRNSVVSLVSQDPFITDGTVADNVAFPHPSGKLDAQKARELLDALGLHWSLDRNVGENGTQLSGGERQRLAVARALYLSPKYLILDEATSQMDEAAAFRTYELIFQKCAHATVLLCTHQDYPKSFCTRHIRVEDGTAKVVD